ncbi:MAG: cupin domain-containing protein [Chloroflexota bacterium]
MVHATEPNVGQNIRSIREQQGYSLRALAERCGLSTNAISLIERGENSPTVSSLHLLAKALNVSITDFFQSDWQQSVVIVRPEERLRSEGEGVVIENLGIGLSNQQMEPFMVTVAPGAGTWGQPVTHPGEEFVYCMAGSLDYQVGERVYHLEPGDSLLFDATLDHSFRAAGPESALLLMIFLAGAGVHLARRVHAVDILETAA